MNDEIWKEIEYYNKKYKISNYGNVLNTKSNKILKASIDSDGYLVVTLLGVNESKTCKIHRLVAIAFINNPENKPTVNHKDGNKKNNNIYNLEWNTVRENICHSYDTGLRSGTRANENQKNAVINFNKKTKAKPINGFVDNILIYEFKSIIDASNFLNIDKSDIAKCCKELKISAGKHNGKKIIWRYSNG